MKKKNPNFFQLVLLTAVAAFLHGNTTIRMNPKNQRKIRKVQSNHRTIRTILNAENMNITQLEENPVKKHAADINNHVVLIL